MDEHGLLDGVFKHYGLNGIIILFLMWEKWNDKKEEKEIKQKQSSGEWVTWQDVKTSQDKIKELSDIVKMNSLIVDEHLKKEALEDIKIAKMENEQDHFKENIVEIKDNQKAIFTMIADIKSFLIKQKE